MNVKLFSILDTCVEQHQDKNSIKIVFNIINRNANIKQYMKLYILPKMGTLQKMGTHINKNNL